MILWSEDRRAHDFGIVDAASSFALPGLYDNYAKITIFSIASSRAVTVPTLRPSNTSARNGGTVDTL
jgi:hypothetical protein